MKKIMNDKNTLVSDMLKGYVEAYSNRVKLVEPNLICRSVPKQKGKVGIVIGNGSGHEPAMIDLVGKGLLDVNVVGKIFTAPPPFDMLEGIKQADYGAGVLVMVSSHQGDILNARMAIMLAEAEGIQAKMVILYDDIFSAPKGQEKERRGTAGLFFCWKIVGAAAESGADLDTCIALAQKVRDNTRTLSVAVSSGTNPETGLKTFELPEDEIEVGMGVHGEAGKGRMKLTTAKDIVNYMMKELIEDKAFHSGEDVMVLLNNSGSTTRMELMIIYKCIAEYLALEGIHVARNWVGTYVTTQEMAGFSISLCKTDNEMLSYYDDIADSPLF